MTTLGKITVIAGICIFTASTLLWIIQGDWQWFAGGGAIFLGTLLSGAVISAETKPSPTRSIPSPPSPPPSSDSSDPDTDKPYTYTYSATDRPPNTADTLPDWTPPSTPPPDDPDPFSRPSLVPPPTN
jgi:hypothetical protein